MLHPGRGPDGVKTTGMVVRSSALQGLEIEYTGKPAHAGMSPWEGINALDAATSAYTSISSLRQQLKPDTRVQGVITDGGGPAANVIPARTAMSYMIRGNTAKDVEHTVERVLACFEGAATSSGCKLKTEPSHRLDELRNVEALGDEYARAMNDMYGSTPDGAHIQLTYGDTMGASTDFGNITHLLPGCHPMFGIATAPGAFNHMPGFTAGAGSKEAFAESMKHTAAMSAVGVRYLLDAQFADSVAKGWVDMMDKVRKE
jgi:metal-dependent amidase/aminoacylase/carboxypeptidase family protein